MCLRDGENALGFEEALWFNQTRSFVQSSHLSQLESGIILGREGLICLSLATRQKGRRRTVISGDCSYLHHT